MFKAPHVANSMASLTSQSYGDSLTAVCLSRKVYRLHEHSWMSDRLKNEASVKQTVVLLAMKHTYTVSILLYPLSGDEKCTLKLCAREALFGNQEHQGF